jgi:hypothetical protein
MSPYNRNAMRGLFRPVDVFDHRRAGELELENLLKRSRHRQYEI